MSIFGTSPKRPIFIRGAYIFDILGESNMSQTTTAVTVIKKGSHKDSWIVLSINSGDIFECHESLLTPIVDYDESIAPIIRIQYCSTDFTMADSLAYDWLYSKFEKSIKGIIDDEEESDTMKQLAKNFIERYKEIGEKIHKFSEASAYKYTISTIKNVKDLVQEHIETKKTLEKEEDTQHTEDISEAEHFKDAIQVSKFYEEFNALTNMYNPTFNADNAISLDEFLDKALDALENTFPREALIPANEKYKTIQKEEIQWLYDSCIDYLRKNNIVFMVGVNSEGEQIAVAIYDTSDKEEILNFINACYYKWTNKNESYYSEYRISIITVALNKRDLHNHEEE